MNNNPSPAETNGASIGRDARGKFVAGNSIGKGNPFGRAVNELRREMLEEAGSGDPPRLRRVVMKLYDLAEAGDVAAAKLCVEHAIGRPVQTNVIEAGDESPVKLLPSEVWDRL